MFSETDDNIREAALGIPMFGERGDTLIETGFVISMLNCSSNTVRELTLGIPMFSENCDNVRETAPRIPMFC